MGEVDIERFIKTRLPERVGEVVTSQGEVIGQHQGVHFYTEGQRRGLGIGGGIPYYVAGKDVEHNVLTVAKGFNDPILYSRELTASKVNWVNAICHPELVEGWPLKCSAQIRYRQSAQDCTIKKEGNNLYVTFDQPQRAVTPGQSIVFYEGDELLGGGIID